MMERNKSPIIFERYCPVVDANVVIMKNIVQNDGSCRCISHIECSEREKCDAFSPAKDNTADTAS